jgi:hypothetical protein
MPCPVTWNPAQMMGISNPTGITQGPDGAIWFTTAGNNSIGRITKSGKKVSSYTGPGISNPAGIAPGPDGALWFANHGSASLGRITIKINSSSRAGAPRSTLTINDHRLTGASTVTLGCTTSMISGAPSRRSGSPEGAGRWSQRNRGRPSNDRVNMRVSA